MRNVAVMGYGTVGTGVVEILKENKEEITKRAGEEVSLKYVLDIREFPGDPVEDVLIHDFQTIVEDDSVQIVVEVMGGLNPAYPFVKACLEAGKHVVTSNKALVAKYGAELLAIAKEKNVNFLFEASVGGGIPIIRALHSSLTADVIEEITGILNGTTNYMLSKMFYEGCNYDEVLKEAQEMGYAERNPEADVEGHDACRKIAILSSMITGHQVDFEDIYTEGITKITKEDMMYARAMNMSIKLLAGSWRVGDGICALVSPALLEKGHPLSSVDNVFNAVFVRGNMLGDAMFYGSGAGKLPTASAVVADIVAAAKSLDKSDMPMWDSSKVKLLPVKELSRRFFVRIKGEEGALLPKIEESFGKVQVVKAEGLDGEFGFVTGVLSEGEYENRAEAFPEIVQMIRVAG